MMDPVLIRILQLCIANDSFAVMLYRKMLGAFDDTEVKAFWKEMARQESQHVAYWKGLLELAEQNIVRNIFDHPEQIEKELTTVRDRMEKLICDWPAQMDLKTAFRSAYQAEFIMMHPAFAAMFHLMRNETKDFSPEDNYEKHIGGLIEAARKFLGVDPEMALIAELSEQLWENNRQLSVRLADIQLLRNLIPICMHCKNVRNDKGFWGKVENYLSAHSDMQFSHGICPDCMKKYYPEFADPDQEEKET